MVSSTLNPTAITRNSPTSFESFGNFMLGENYEKSLNISNAANKIVNFNRSSVAPITPNISSLITNISTNILNQVDNSIRNTTNFLKDDTDRKITQLQKDLYSRITELQNNINQLQKDARDTTDEIRNQITTQIQVKTQEIENLTAEVQTRPQVQPEVSPLVQNQTLVTNFNSVVENIQNQVDNVLNTTIRNFSKDYQDKIKGFDDTRPNNVLSKFLDLYRNAIGFVNFFGDNRNTKTIEKNLKALRKIFTDSFEVAAVLRQTIIKIVNQLSNLPTASPSSGGLNLDIEVPGGRLRQAGGSRIRNIVRAGGIAGAGLLGLGGAAAAMTGMGRAREYQESLLSGGVSAASGESYIPENIVESFSGIVDRFTSAVNELVNGAKRSAGAPGGGGGGGATPGGPGAGDVNVDTSSLASFIGEVESGNSYTKLVGGAEDKSILNKTISQLNQERGGLFAMGRYQIQMNTAMDVLRGSGIDPSTFTFTQENQDKLFKMLLERRGLNEFLSGKITKEQFALRLSQEWAALPKDAGGKSYYAGVGKNAALRTWDDTLKMIEGLKSSGGGSIFGSQSTTQSRTQPQQASQATQSQQPPSITSQQPTQTPQTPRVAPAPASAQRIEATAGTIAQPAQQVPQTISLPPTVIDATGGQQQPSQAASVPTAPSAPPSPGPEVPFLPTTNPDNFLTMYSRIVYNIVDG